MALGKGSLSRVCPCGARQRFFAKSRQRLFSEKNELISLPRASLWPSAKDIFKKKEKKFSLSPPGPTRAPNPNAHTRSPCTPSPPACRRRRTPSATAVDQIRRSQPTPHPPPALARPSPAPCAAAASLHPARSLQESSLSPEGGGGTRRAEETPSSRARRDRG